MMRWTLGALQLAALWRVMKRDMMQVLTCLAHVACAAASGVAAHVQALLHFLLDGAGATAVVARGALQQAVWYSFDLTAISTTAQTSMLAS